MSRLKAYSLVLLSVVVIWAVRTFAMPWSDDMYQQPAVWPYELPLIFPPNSVSTDEETEPLGDRAEIEAITVNPNEPTKAALRQGEQAFETYCVACHGPQGKGDGPVIKKGFYPVDLTAPGPKGRTDGYIYAYIRYGGKVMMPSYAESISSEEAWNVVNFVRKLQGSLDTTTNKAEEKAE